MKKQFTILLLLMFSIIELRPALAASPEESKIGKFFGYCANLLRGGDEEALKAVSHKSDFQVMWDELLGYTSVDSQSGDVTSEKEESHQMPTASNSDLEVSNHLENAKIYGNGGTNPEPESRRAEVAVNEEERDLGQRYIYGAEVTRNHDGTRTYDWSRQKIERNSDGTKTYDWSGQKIDRNSDGTKLTVGADKRLIVTAMEQKLTVGADKRLIVTVMAAESMTSGGIDCCQVKSGEHLWRATSGLC